MASFNGPYTWIFRGLDDKFNEIYNVVDVNGKTVDYFLNGKLKVWVGDSIANAQRAADLLTANDAGYLAKIATAYEVPEAASAGVGRALLANIRNLQTIRAGITEVEAGAALDAEIASLVETAALVIAL